VKPTNINFCIQINNEFTIFTLKAFTLTSQIKIDNRYKEFYWSPHVIKQDVYAIKNCSKKLNWINKISIYWYVTSKSHRAIED